MVAVVARVVLAIAVAYGAWRAPALLRAIHDEGTALAALSETDRVEAAARSVDIDMRLLRAAERVIPPDASFAVVTGDGVDVSAPVTLTAFPAYAAYWLLPRRALLDPGEADWIVSFGGNLDALGLRYARVVEVAEGMRLAEVAR
jgi:hypothetical protein